MDKGFRYAISAIIVLLLASCSSTKYVPDGSYLLDKVRIQSDNKDVKSVDLALYVRQNPNARWFSLVKTPLYIYGWSGRDSTRWINRTLREMGDAPVIYSEEEALRTSEELTKAVRNMGYMGASVEPLQQINKKKLKLTYKITTGRPYIVRSLKYDIQDKKVEEYMRRDSAATLLHEGMCLDVNVLDAERQRITNTLLQNGYYKFNKEYVTYTADTIRNTYLVDLTLHLALYKQTTESQPEQHRQYTINKVNFITDFNVLQSSIMGGIEVNDSLHYKGFPIYYKDKLYLRPKILASNLRIKPGSLYNEQDVQTTYSNFGRLQVLKYTNIRFFEVQQQDSLKLNAYVMLTKNKHQSVSFEVEGTNSAGDLGVAAAVSFHNRNVFKGSETFMLRLRGAYEAVSGLQSSLNQDYIELGAEATINFPRFIFPFVSSDFKQRIRATTEFGLQYSYQMRPEFTRIVASGGWSYKWGVHQQRSQHRIDMLDINYLYMPWIDSDFKEKYLDTNENYILRYNYEDRFIVRTGYSYTYNSAGKALLNNSPIGNSYTLHVNFESAGNFLYLLAKAGCMKEDDETGEYTLFSIPFAQYLKGDFSYAKNWMIDNRNSITFHFAGGIAYPYGNASIIPFEKRYFAGGANSVRGWSVRELGPGSFKGDGNFLNQSGDIKLDASVEYRTSMFWKFRGAVFVDAGNIWTIRNYADQEGGQFKFNKFYKQIAVAYGLGLRLDLDFFILRFDGGMRAVNPVHENRREQFPIIHPKLSRDFAFHFAVGYPF